MKRLEFGKEGTVEAQVGRPRRGVLRALAGRQAERDAFARSLESAVAGSPQVLVFEGEAGSGKSSLLEEIESSPLLPRRRIRVALLRVTSADAEDVVGQAAHAVTRIGAYRRLGGRRRFAAMLDRVLPEWMGAIPGWGDLLEAIATTVSAVRRRRQRRRGIAARAPLPEDIHEVLRQARRRPVALLLDDLHLASEAAARRLDTLLRSADTGTRLLVVGTVAAPAPGAPRSPFRTLMERLPGSRLVHRRLPPLEPADIADWLVEQFPGAVPPATFVRALFAVTGGQPGPVEALIEDAVARSAIRRDASGWRFDEAVFADPSGEAKLPEADLGALPANVAEIVRVASVLGDEFDGLALARLVGKEELFIEDQLAIAARSGLVQVIGSSALDGEDFTTRYRFTSSALRAALYRGLGADARARFEARRHTTP